MLADYIIKDIQIYFHNFLKFENIILNFLKMEGSLELEIQKHFPWIMEPLMGSAHRNNIFLLLVTADQITLPEIKETNTTYTHLINNGSHPIPNITSQ
jgi:hypothetical protein